MPSACDRFAPLLGADRGSDRGTGDAQNVTFPRVTVIDDTRSDYQGIYLDGRCVWQGGPDDLDLVSLLGELGISAASGKAEYSDYGACMPAHLDELPYRS